MIAKINHMRARWTDQFRIILFLFILSAPWLPAQAVFADTGPKPTMEFTFKQELTGDLVTIVSGILYECDQPDCSDAAPLEALGPQRFTCEVESCHALAYGFAPYHRLEIEFSDGLTRESNIFETAGFDSKYMVTVQPDDLLVESQLSLGILPSMAILVITGICVLVGLGLLVGLIILFRRRSSKN